ncbi:protein lethal(2)denticleless-like [Palaemon carinicauda]|uniref:protein lethal(2)denticleless-like n=1 Tax=Palaemon carinicauda TaxID=392227 RepID=UPI0035B5D592
MRIKARSHVIYELFDRDIDLRVQERKAQRSLFARSFRCYQEDEYDGIALDLLEASGQSSSEAPIYACRFGSGKYGHILVLANEDGKLALRDTRDRSSQAAIEGHQIHGNAIYEVCWIPGTSEFVSASGDQSAAILTVRDDGSVEKVLSLLGHSRSVKTVHVNPFDPYVIATGGRDGSIIIWDKRCKPHYRADDIAPAHYNQVLKTLSSPSVRKATQSGSSVNNSVTGVVFQLQHTLISSGASDGLLKIWDLRKTHSGVKRDPQCQNVLMHSGKSSHRGFTCMSVSPNRDVLYTSCMDNIIYAYHLANPTQKPVAEYSGHVNSTYFVKSCLSPCGSYLLSGSSDNNAYIWLTDKPGEPVAKLTGHFAEVTSVGWCPVDDEKIVTCADDMKLRVFRRKNVNDDDFEERLNTRGVSEAYYSDKLIEKTEKSKIEVSPEHSNTNSTQESKDSIPPLPVTPSSSKASVSFPATPSGSNVKESLAAMSPQAYAVTPKQQTPRHRHKGKTKGTPRTPQTSERNTLLQWLATAKTPGSKESSSDQPMTVSESKKANLKRKLTELLSEDQENVEKDKKEKSPHSSPKKVLCLSASVNTVDSPPPTVAKMLKYQEDEESRSLKVCNEETSEMNECVKPIEDGDKVALHTGFRKPVTNIVKRMLDDDDLLDSCRITNKVPSKFESNNLTPSKPFRFGSLSSPTANLPNYVLDGSSPHNRPETPKEKKRNPDWLTNFGHQRKLKFSAVPDKGNLGRIGSLVPHRRQKKILQIKRKKPSSIKV